MSDTTIDLLQIKIEKAKSELPQATLDAINAVDWKSSIIELRQKKGYSFEQLSALELETELVLCGLVSPADYPTELGKRMGFSKALVDELVNEMNEIVFKRIREEIVKNSERQKIFGKKEENPAKPIVPPPVITPKVNPVITPLATPALTLTLTPAPVLPVILTATIPPSILTQKLSSVVQIPKVETVHSLENITKTPPALAPVNSSPKVDPYREIPE